MEVRVSIEKVLPLESGVSKAGNSWRKLLFIGNTYEEYQKKIAFTLFGDNVDKYQPMLQTNADLNVSFDISSREWVDSKGLSRWSTEVSVWKIENGANAQPQPAQQPQAEANYDAQAAAYFAAASANAPQPMVASPQPQPEIDSLPF